MQTSIASCKLYDMGNALDRDLPPKRPCPSGMHLTLPVACERDCHNSLPGPPQVTHIRESLGTRLLQQLLLEGVAYENVLFSPPTPLRRPYPSLALQSRLYCTWWE